MTDDPAPLPPATDFDPRYFDGASDHDEQDLLTTTIARRRLDAVIDKTTTQRDAAEAAGDAGAAAALTDRLRALRESLARLPEESG